MRQSNHSISDSIPLREELEILREENKQLRELISPDAPPMHGLTILEWRVVWILLKYSPITKERLYELVYWGRDTPPSANTISVVLCRARPKLAAQGIFIKTLSRWGYEIHWDQLKKLHNVKDKRYFTSPANSTGPSHAR
ncbi:MAG: helix-turn-helix domain-containing protein [Robiginitomaculum sp.]|nr:helix-turn-helix domain-containing protein [Robiginitomaculum sp.]MBN4051735.1 helix-turn-helix domain-containing protein [Parvibaculum lavamentivorans]